MFLLCLAGASFVNAPAQLALPDMVVSTTRAPMPPSQVPFSVVNLPGDDLRTAPTVTIDDALRAVPGFSLFRRSDSLTANPTAQGVSLRGLGPSGASRSLVLLDGVPLNDPFGGWVNWSKVPRESLARVELVRGGGATAWGNAALGGIVQLFTETPADARSRLSASYGRFATRSAEFELTQPAGRGTLQLSGRDFATDGFALVAPEDRGPIDIAAWNRHHWLAGRWSQPAGRNGVLTISARTYGETRDNGTPYQVNTSRENSVAATFDAKAGDHFAWNATAYAQDQAYTSTFSSVNATRTAETPASNQYDVPAAAWGAAWTGTWSAPDGARTSIGGDWRGVRGETREYYTFANGNFTRQRVAGGTQDIAGVFALHERPLASDWTLTLGARLDDWRESNGHRRETDRATGTTLRDDHYASHDGLEFSPSAGLVWQPAKGWRFRAAGQQAFRRPTLNELYRPFRVGNVITEANPALKTERVTSAELGAEYSSGFWKFTAAAFWNELHDAVGNVTLAHGPGSFPIVGFVPAGGLGRQRLNLDRTRVRGLELSAHWQPLVELGFDAAFLYDDASVQAATVAPALVGKRLAQVPRQSATLGAVWRLPGGFTFTPRVRWLGRQFEDDENQLVLGEAVVTDLNVSYALGRRGEFFATAENLGNARIETGRSADGLVNTGTPRLVLGGFRTAW
ncbi:MAG TPA: TonB-dependent receptor [Lacunisphaera sp.]|nr:TonB-dependent receptor [Lacunisphaera sp.]